MVAPIWPIDVVKNYTYINNGSTSPLYFSVRLKDLSESVTQIINTVNGKILSPEFIYADTIISSDEIYEKGKFSLKNMTQDCLEMICGITPTEDFLRGVKVTLTDLILRSINLFPYNRIDSSTFIIICDNSLNEFHRYWPSNHPITPQLLLGDISLDDLGDVMSHHIQPDGYLIISPSIDTFLKTESLDTCQGHEPMQYQRFLATEAPDPANYVDLLIKLVKTRKWPQYSVIILADLIAGTFEENQREVFKQHHKVHSENALQSIFNRIKPDFQVFQDYIDSLNKALRDSCILNQIPFLTSFGLKAPSTGISKCAEMNSTISYFKQALDNLFESLPLTLNAMATKREISKEPISLKMNSYSVVNSICSGNITNIDFKEQVEKADAKEKLLPETEKYVKSRFMPHPFPSQETKKMDKGKVSAKERITAPIAEPESRPPSQQLDQRLYDPRQDSHGEWQRSAAMGQIT